MSAYSQAHRNLRRFQNVITAYMGNPVQTVVNIPELEVSTIVVRLRDALNFACKLDFQPDDIKIDITGLKAMRSSIQVVEQDGQCLMMPKIKKFQLTESTASPVNMLTINKPNADAIRAICVLASARAIPPFLITGTPLESITPISNAYDCTVMEETNGYTII